MRPRQPAAAVRDTVSWHSGMDHACDQQQEGLPAWFTFKKGGEPVRKALIGQVATTSFCLFVRKPCSQCRSPVCMQMASPGLGMKCALIHFNHLLTPSMSACKTFCPFAVECFYSWPAQVVRTAPLSAICDTNISNVIAGPGDTHCLRAVFTTVKGLQL